MDKAIIAEKNAIKIKLRDLENYIKLSQNAISRLRHAKTNIEFNKTKIKKNKDDIAKFTEEISKLNQRLIDADSGLLNEEIRKQMKEHTQIQREKSKKTLKIKQNKIKDTQEKHKDFKKHIEMLKMGRREGRWAIKNAQRGYTYFCKVINSIPQYMLAKLNSMPNNKGYIWRGVILYGEKEREENKPTVLFEKKKGVLYIHEWSCDLCVEKIFVKDDDFQWLFQKKIFEPNPGTKRRKLISTQNFQKPSSMPSKSRRRNSRHHTRPTNGKVNNSGKKQLRSNHRKKLTLQQRRSRSRQQNKGTYLTLRKARPQNQQRSRGRSRPKSEHVQSEKGRGRGRHMTKPAWMTKRENMK